MASFDLTSSSAVLRFSMILSGVLKRGARVGELVICLVVASSYVNSFCSYCYLDFSFLSFFSSFCLLFLLFFIIILRILMHASTNLWVDIKIKKKTTGKLFFN